MTRLLIVNADDFGLTAGVNRGVIEGHVRGIVTSASMLANMPGFQNAAALAREHRGLAVGLHLNLTYGRPLSPSALMSGLIDPDGFFHGDPERILATAEPAAVQAEFWAQARRFLAAGLRPSHLDTHHHLHRSGRILDLVAQLAKTLDVPVRCLDAPMMRARGLPTLARYRPFRGGRRGAERLLALLASLPEGATEISCHPGYNDAELEKLSALNRRREWDLAAVTDPRVVSSVRDQGIVLTNCPALRRTAKGALSPGPFLVPVTG